MFPPQPARSRRWAAVKLMNFIDPRLDLGADLDILRVEIRPELIQIGGADDVRGHERTARYVSQGQLRRVKAEVAGDIEVFVDCLFGPRLLITVRALKQCRAGASRSGTPLVFAGQKTLRQRRIRQQPNLLASANSDRPAS